MLRVQTSDGEILNTVTTLYGHSGYTGVYALAAVANDLWAAAGSRTESVTGSQAESVMGSWAEVSDVRVSNVEVSVQIEMPEYTFSSRLHAIQREVKEACKSQNIELKEMTHRKHEGVTLPMVTVSGIARAPKEEAWCKDTLRAGQDIVLAGYIGMEGMLRILDEREQELKKRFAPVFIEQIRSYRQQLFAGPAISVAKAGGSSAIRQVSEGGILAALWDLAKDADEGLAVDMKKLNILQETVEVCEHYRINPYQLASTGCMLIVTDQGEALADELNRNHIKGTVIGTLTDNNDKILHNGEEVRYIDRPAPDEILKMYGGTYHG